MQCQFLNSVGMQCPETLWEHSHLFHGNTQFCNKHVCQFPLCEKSIMRTKGSKYCEEHINIKYCRSPIRVGVQCWTRCCGEIPINGNNFCSKHKCISCDNDNYGQMYCSKHKCVNCSDKKMDDSTVCQKCYDSLHKLLSCQYIDNNGIKCLDPSLDLLHILGKHVDKNSEYCSKHTCQYSDDYHGDYCLEKICDDTSIYCGNHCSKCVYPGCGKYTSDETCDEHKCSKCYECCVVSEPIKLCERHKAEYEFNLHEFDE